MSIDQEVVVTREEIDRACVDIDREAAPDVVLEREVSVRTASHETIIVDGERQVAALTEVEREIEFVSLGQQGPRGAQGPIGPAGGTAFERISGDAISALRVVWEDADGTVLPIDYRDDAHIDLIAGVTISAAAAAGLPVTVQRGGIVDVSGLGLALGRVWLGANGTLTQTPPNDGFDVLVGYAVSTSRLIVAFSDHIELPE